MASKTNEKKGEQVEAGGFGDNRASAPSGVGVPPASCGAGVSPASPSSVSVPLASTSVPSSLNLAFYRAMVMAREIDRVELDLVRRGLAFFHVSGAGHEVTACLARHLTPDDWLHVHYRDKALLLARGLPIEEFFASLLCRAGSHSESPQMSAHFSAPRLNVLGQTGPVGNRALQAVGVAALDDQSVKAVVARRATDCSGNPSFPVHQIKWSSACQLN